MFVINLRFVDKSKASQLMDGHNDWIKRGFEEGVFLLTGGLQPHRGGVIIAHNVSRDDIEARVHADPFVSEGVVSPEILEITVSRADERLTFLKG